MNLVLDASVAAKWVLVEEDTDKARAIFDAFTARRIALLAPQILPAEVASTLWKRVMRGLLPPDAATRLQTQFDSVMVPLSPIDDLVGTALGLAIRYRHSVAPRPSPTGRSDRAAAFSDARERARRYSATAALSLS